MIVRLCVCATVCVCVCVCMGLSFSLIIPRLRQIEGILPFVLNLYTIYPQITAEQVCHAGFCVRVSFSLVRCVRLTLMPCWPQSPFVCCGIARSFQSVDEGVHSVTDVFWMHVCVHRSIYHTGDYVRHVYAQWCSMSALVCGFQCCVYLVTASHNFQCESQAESSSWFKEKILNLFNKRIKYKYVKSTIYVVAYLLTWKKRYKHLDLTGLAVGALIRQSTQVFQAGLRNTDFFEILQFINMLPVYLICPLVSDNYRL